MELTMSEQSKLSEFLDEHKAYRRQMETSVAEIKHTVSGIQLTLAEEKGKDIPARLKSIEMELDALRSFKDSAIGSITSLKWVVGVGMAFMSSLLVALIVLVAREMIFK
jgi:hypothetical protein